MSRRLALIVGNSRYDDPGLASLGAPDVDVREFGEALRSADVGQFDEVVQLVDETSPTVRRAIAQLFHLKRREDLVLLYFSGHGIRDDQGQLHLATRDTERSLLSATAIEASFISGEMDRSQSRRQVLILDCCHSGAFGGKSALGASIGIGSAFEGIGFGRVVLTATDATQYAWEGDRVIGEAEPSLFTNFLVLGIQSGAADLNGDGEITIDELYEYAYDEVVNSTSKQVPGKWAFKQQGEIVIARNPRGVRAAALPLALIEKINTPLIGLQLEAIRDLVVILRGQHRARSIAARTALEKLANAGTPDVAGAARSAVAMYPAAGRGAVAVRHEPVTPTAGALQKIAHRQLSKLSALVLVVLALILFGALGIWNASRRGTIAGPSTSPPPRTEPSAVPTTGTPPTRSAQRADTPTEAGSKVAEGTYNSAPEAKDKSESGRADAPGARGSPSRAAREAPRGNQGPGTKARSSSSGSSSVTASPTDAPTPAPKEREPATGATSRPTDSAALDRQAILDVLERYRQAYNRKDLAAIREVYPTVRGNLFGRGQRDCFSFNLRFVGPPIVHLHSGDSAQVETSSVYECIPKAKSGPSISQPVQDAFVFAKTNGTWVIQRQWIELGK